MSARRVSVADFVRLEGVTDDVYSIDHWHHVLTGMTLWRRLRGLQTPQERLDAFCQMMHDTQAVKMPLLTCDADDLLAVVEHERRGLCA